MNENSNEGEVSLMDQMIAASNAARKKITVKKEKELTKKFGDGMNLTGALYVFVKLYL